MAGFDHKCPYCSVEIDVHAKWMDHDYSTDFRVQCQACERSVQIDVSMAPEFETSKPICSMCHKSEPAGSPWYCEPCHKQLQELSKLNAKKV